MEMIINSCIADCTFVYPSQTPEVHLVWAVEDHNIFSQTAAHVFDSLCLA